VLTYNSSKYIEKIVLQLSKFADEIVIVDSGSNDNTLRIISKYDIVKIYERKFDNFKNQRNYAADKCCNDWIFFVDSDEIPDDGVVNSIINLKNKELSSNIAFSFLRTWIVMGKFIHSLYPIQNPDNVVRLFNRTQVSFGESSNLVHETIGGYSQKETLAGNIMHYTFETKEEIYSKVDKYTNLAAKDLLLRGRKVSYFKLIFDPPAAFVKWYLFKKGFLDGWIGFVLGKYAYCYTKLKYSKALKLANQIKSSKINLK
ncbi:MAG: glycosyltransferase family 2 protein, partial [Bacteroidales bacterium]|nr:glycosyltransferase family 2 protein [Bacteroidales bacterium]